MTYAILGTDDSVTLHEGVPDLAKLQEVVGGYVETITIFGGDGRHRAILWVNEDGNRLNLILNESAMAAAAFRGHSIPVRGNVVVTGTAGNDGETLGLTEYWIGYFGTLAGEPAR